MLSFSQITGSHWQSHPEFILRLPYVSIKKLIYNLVIIILIGVPGSFLMLAIYHWATDFSYLGDFFGLPNIFFQGFPIVLVTYLTFYKGSLREQWSIMCSKRSNKSVLLIALTLLLMFLTGYILQLASTYIFIPDPISIFEEYVKRGADQIDLQWIRSISYSLLSMFVLATFEEFVFRYTIYRHLRRRGLVTALLVSSALFGLVHHVGPLGAFVFGLIIALYYERTNNFWGAVTIHALTNVFLVWYTNYAVYHTLLLFS